MPRSAASHGTNNYELNALAFLAVHAEDFETAKQAFKEIGENWDSNVWESKSQFDSGRLLPSLKPVPLAPSKQMSTVH